MGEWRVIARAAVREVRHTRVVYVVVLLALVVVAASAAPLAMVRMATEAGETRLAADLAGRVVASALGAWGGAATLLAVFLGAPAVSSEIRARTIVTVLARPVARWQYVVGRWAGIQLFVLGFLGAGVVAAVVFAHAYHVALPGLFWLAVLDLAGNAVLHGASSVGLGTVLPPAAAGATVLLLRALPGLLRPVAAYLPSVPPALVAGLYYVAPAAMPVALLQRSFGAPLLAPRHGLYALVVAENVLYGVAVLLVGCLVFTRREIRLG
jgi:Cu-processing system permease protein